MSGSDEHYITGTNTVTADGYGSLITPDGISLSDIIRIHSVENVRDSNALFGITNRIQHNYYWYSASQRGYILRFEMSGSDSTIISSAYFQKQTNLINSVPIVINNSNLIIYPNPGTGKFLINSIDDYNASLAIYDLMGQFVKEINRPFIRGVNELNLDFLPSGMYLIKVSSERQSHTQKLVVE
jgi:hypothetical protein